MVINTVVGRFYLALLMRYEHGVIYRWQIDGCHTLFVLDLELTLFKSHPGTGRDKLDQVMDCPWIQNNPRVKTSLPNLRHSELKISNMIQHALPIPSPLEPRFETSQKKSGTMSPAGCPSTC